MLVQTIPDTIFRVNNRGFVTLFKPAKDSSLSLLTESPVGKNILKCFPQCLADKMQQAIAAALLTNSTQIFQYELIEDQAAQYIEVRVASIDNEDILAIVRDITNQIRLEQRLTYLSFHDALTGIYNRAYFENKMKFYRENPITPLGIVVCDIDNLKSINDSCGHQYGDKAIAACATIICSAFRETDIVARIGGDEFAAILPGADEKIMKNACQRIRYGLDHFNQQNELHIPLSVSVGMSGRTDSSTSMDDLFKQADNRMYQEKFKAQKIHIRNQYQD